jgi:hypothetical protein
MPYTIGTLIFGIDIHNVMIGAKRYAEEEFGIPDEDWDDFCINYDLNIGEYYSWFGIELWEFDETKVLRYSHLERETMIDSVESLSSEYREKLSKLPRWLQERFCELPDFLIMWSHS